MEPDGAVGGGRDTEREPDPGRDVVSARRPVTRGPARLARPLGRSVAFAVVGTLVLAVAAAQLRPGQGPGPAARPTASSPAGSPTASSASPTRSPVPTPSQLLSLQTFGLAAPPDTLLVHSGGWSTLDLATGTLRNLGWADWPSRLLPRPNGGFVCLCVAATASGDEEHAVVSIRAINQDGSQGPASKLYELVGTLDPRVAPDEQGSSVLLSAALSPDGRFLLVGRAVREPPEWVVGMDVVALASGRLVRSFELTRSASNRSDELATPAAGSGPAATPGIVGGVDAWPPQIAVARDGPHALLWLVEVRGNHVTSQRHLFASVGAAGVEEPKPFPAADTGGSELCGSWAFADGQRLIRLCAPANGGSAWSLERLRIDGRSDPVVGLDVGPSLVWGRVLDRSGRLWLWDPFTWWIGRVDLESGTVESRRLPRPTTAAPGDRLAALLRGLAAWVAPSAAAKILIEPALAISPDGSRLYGLTAASRSAGEGFGSAGIVVIDAATLTMVDRWEPVADLASLAVSADGRFVYAAGVPGVDASGERAPSWQASLTGYDADTGEVRLIAGRLGSSWLLFPATDDPWWSAVGRF